MAAKRSASSASSSASIATDGVLDQVRERVSTVGGMLKNTAQVARDQVTERLSKATRTIKEEAARLAEDQKNWAAAEIGSVGSAVHESARKLHDSNIDGIAGYVDAAAQRLDDVASYLEEHDLADLIEPVADVVRKHPAAFIGGFLAAGILLGRFIKAGQPPPVPSQRAAESAGATRRSRSKRSRGSR